MSLSLAWGALMAFSALTSLFLQERIAGVHLSGILLLYFLGGATAFPVAVFVAATLAAGRRAETRFAAFLLCLTLITIAGTAFLFAMHYRIFFSRWHAPFGTMIGTYQFVYTSASATYQFIVMGIRLFMPAGLAALAGMSFWMTARTSIRR